MGIALPFASSGFELSWQLLQHDRRNSTSDSLVSKPHTPNLLLSPKALSTTSTLARARQHVQKILNPKPSLLPEPQNHSSMLLALTKAAARASEPVVGWFFVCFRWGPVITHRPLYNPSTLLIKGPIFKGNFSADVGRSVCVSITWDFVWGKGTIFKEIYWHGPFG